MVTGTAERSASERTRRREPLVGQDRRVDATRELPELVECCLAARPRLRRAARPRRSLPRRAARGRAGARARARAGAAARRRAGSARAGVAPRLPPATMRARSSAPPRAGAGALPAAARSRARAAPRRRLPRADPRRSRSVGSWTSAATGASAGPRTVTARSGPGCGQLERPPLAVDVRRRARAARARARGTDRRASAPARREREPGGVRSSSTTRSATAERAPRPRADRPRAPLGRRARRAVTIQNHAGVVARRVHRRAEERELRQRTGRRRRTAASESGRTTRRPPGSTARACGRAARGRSAARGSRTSRARSRRPAMSCEPDVRDRRAQWKHRTR